MMRRVVRVPSLARGAGLRLRLIPTTSPPTTRLLLLRPICGSRVLGTRKKAPSDAQEAALLQQMLEAMNDGSDADAGATAALSKSPDEGAVLDVKNNVASMSGLRRATLGSVVSIYDADDKCVCRGVVLLLGKHAAHVAFFNDQEHVDAVRKVQIGMHVRLDAPELRIPVSIAGLTGRAIDPVGDPVPLIYGVSEGNANANVQANTQAEEVNSMPPATDELPISWGSRSVPPLMARANVNEPFTTGILALDCLSPIAMGHRFGIFGSKNSGKTRLMVDIVAQQVRAAKDAGVEPPHFVYVCVGKSPSRVQRILQLLEQNGALPHTTIVSADTQRSLMMRYLAPFTGCAVAEYFMKNSRSHQSVVIYDDLATHTTVVESLVQIMKLPKISRIGLGAHAVLMERAGQFGSPMDSSITAFALADTPDTTTREVSELKEHVLSIVDDAVQFDSHLAVYRVYPPLDVLLPGPSIRGPPYQSAALWKHMTALRARINEAHQIRLRVNHSAKLGLDLKPEEADILDFQKLVRQFFAQEQYTPIRRVQKEVGVFVLSTIQMAKVPPHLKFWTLMDALVTTLEQNNAELLEQLESYPLAQAWSKVVEDELQQVLAKVLKQLRKEATQAQAETKAEADAGGKGKDKGKNQD